MFHSKPFKKDLTPFAKGGKVVKHIGKGAKEQSNTSFGSLTGGDALARMANSYPKAAAGPAPTESLGGPPMGSSPPVPQGSRPPGAPTAMMPGGGEPDEDDMA